MSTGTEEPTGTGDGPAAPAGRPRWIETAAIAALAFVLVKGVGWLIVTFALGSS